MTELTLRDGYKTLTLLTNQDGTVRVSVHRPPQAWLEFNLDEAAIEKLSAWLERRKGRG